MIIDFHTHVYPEAMAEKIMAALGRFPGVEGHTDGTLRALLDSMTRGGIDKSIIMPVNTRKGQFDSITRFAEKINASYDSLISFGGIHPDDDEPEEKLAYLKEHGFKGIKIHPDYTETFIHDERYIRIIAECQRLGLIVLSHAGKDPAYKVIHCPPDKGRAMLDRVHELTGFVDPFFIFAHLGGNQQVKDVEKYLVGQNCYIDVSCCFHDLGHFTDTTDEEIVRVIKSHGADKILFATDSPWNDQRAYVGRFKSLPGLNDREKELILGQNAAKLLGLTMD